MKASRCLNIGLCYDLRERYLELGFSEEETAEFDRPDTIDAIENALSSLGHHCERIGGLRDLLNLLAAGRRWDLVFNIAEGMRGFSREAQIPSLLEAYEIPFCFSDPLCLSLCLHKGMTKRVLRDGGLPTPNFIQASCTADLEGHELRFPLFVKPLAEGTGKGISSRSIVRNEDELRDTASELSERFRQGLLVEEYLSGREFTVAVLGTAGSARIVGSAEVRLRGGADLGAYGYKNKENCEELVDYLPCADLEAEEAERLALAAYRILGCRDAGRVDLRSNASAEPQILEINPLPGLHPEHSDLPIICKMIGIPYIDLIETIISSAQKAQTGAEGLCSTKKSL